MLAALGLDVADSLASSATPDGCVSPRVLQHRGDRDAGPASRSPGRDAAGAARRRWPRRGGRGRGRSARRRTARASRADAAPRVQRRGAAGPARAGARSTNSRISRLTLHRVAGVRAVPRAGQLDQLGPPLRARGQRSAGARPDDGVVGAVDDEHRAPHAGEQRSRCRARVADRRPRRRGDQRLRGRSRRPQPMRVLDLLGRVRLGEHLREEELARSPA